MWVVKVRAETLDAKGLLAQLILSSVRTNVYPFGTIMIHRNSRETGGSCVPRNI